MADQELADLCVAFARARLARLQEKASRKSCRCEQADPIGTGSWDEPRAQPCWAADDLPLAEWCQPCLESAKHQKHLHELLGPEQALWRRVRTRLLREQMESEEPQ